MATSVATVGATSARQAAIKFILDKYNAEFLVVQDKERAKRGLKPLSQAKAEREAKSRNLAKKILSNMTEAERAEFLSSL